MKFQKSGEKIFDFAAFQNWFLSNYFEVSPEKLDQNSSLSPFWKANSNRQILKKWKLKILKNSGDWDLASPNCPNVANTLKQVKLDR